MRRLSKKVMSACNRGGDEVACRRSDRVKRIPKKYSDNITCGVTSGCVGTFGTKCGTEQSQRVKVDQKWDLVVGSETERSNCKRNNRCNSDRRVKPASIVQHGTTISLRSNSTMVELHERSLQVDAGLFPRETNQTDCRCSKEMTTVVVEREDKIQHIPPNRDVTEMTHSCKVTSERGTGHCSKYKHRKCDTCQETFATPDALVMHRKCGACKETFVTSDALVMHRKCGACKETFVTSDALVMHRKSCRQRARGPNPRKYDCEQCHYVARTAKLLLIHVNHKHGIPLDAQDKFPVHKCQVSSGSY